MFDAGVVEVSGVGSDKDFLAVADRLERREFASEGLRTLDGFGNLIVFKDAGGIAGNEINFFFAGKRADPDLVAATTELEIEDIFKDVAELGAVRTTEKDTAEARIDKVVFLFGLQ